MLHVYSRLSQRSATITPEFKRLSGMTVQTRCGSMSLISALSIASRPPVPIRCDWSRVGRSRRAYKIGSRRGRHLWQAGNGTSIRRSTGIVQDLELHTDNSPERPIPPLSVLEGAKQRTSARRNDDRHLERARSSAECSHNQRCRTVSFGLAPSSSMWRGGPSFTSWQSRRGGY